MCEIWLKFRRSAHMTVENDGPHEAKNDGGPSIYDIWDVYVHQFDLRQPILTKVSDKIHHTSRYCIFCLFGFSWCVCVETYRLLPEKVQCCFNVGPLLENSTSPLSFLWKTICRTMISNNP